MKSLRAQLTLRLALAVALLFALGAVVSFAVARASLIREFDTALTARAQVIATLTELERDGTIEFEFDDGRMPEYSRAKAPDYFELFAGGEEPVRKSGSLGEGRLEARIGRRGHPLIWDQRLPDGRAGRALSLRFIPRPDTDDPHDLVAPIRPRTPGNPELTLVLAVDRGPLERSLGEMMAGWLTAVVALPLLAAAMVAAIVARGMRPLVGLAQWARQIDAASMAERFESEKLPEELRPIARQINGLLDRAVQTLEREKRFSADAAHELRTPIAELRSLAEVALRWPEDASVALPPGEVLQIALQMERLVETLLQLGRLQSGGQAPRRERLDLCEAIRRTWAPFEEAARVRGVSVQWDLPETAPIESDETAMKSLLANLFANAVQYCPEGGDIEGRLRAREGSQFFSLANPAGDLSADDVRRLADPFWRKDAARADHDRYGLGLALASDFARALGGELEFRIDERSRFVVTLRLPIRIPAEPVEV